MSFGADAQPARRTAAAVLRSHSPIWAAALLSLVLTAIWARYLAGVGGDLAAQWSWADFAAKFPGSAYDLAWYGGIHPASYSLLAPFLMAAVGVRAAGVVSVVISAVLLAHLLTRAGLRWPLPVALWGAFALWCDLAAGRVTFAIGLTFGLAAVVAAGTHRTPGWGRVALATGLSFLAVCASPLAGLFVEVAAAALLLTGRRRAGVALGIPGTARGPADQRPVPLRRRGPGRRHDDRHHRRLRPRGRAARPERSRPPHRSGAWYASAPCSTRPARA